MAVVRGTFFLAWGYSVGALVSSPKQTLPGLLVTVDRRYAVPRRSARELAEAGGPMSDETSSIDARTARSGSISKAPRSGVFTTNLPPAESAAVPQPRLPCDNSMRWLLAAAWLLSLRAAPQQQQPMGQIADSGDRGDEGFRPARAIMRREATVRYMGWFIAAAWLLSLPAAAQQQQSMDWAKLPRMQLERQFGGPLQDTIIQRWRDPVDGTICYIYLPITAAHSPPTASGYVQYGSNTIGSMSCVAAAPAAAPRGAAAPPATTTRPGGGTGTPAPRTSPSPASPLAPAPTAPDAPPASR
jgi:hypothetical protein